MGLLNKDNSAQFESMDDTNDAAADTGTVASTTAATPAADAGVAQTAAAAAPAKQTAVASAAKTSVVVKRNVQGAALSEFKDALPVEYDTLTSIKATNGNFVERESNKVLGDTVVFDLVSFQDSWVVDPGDDKAPKEDVFYSNDGKVCSDGTPVPEALQLLINKGYDKARVKERCVVVGGIISAAKTADFNEQLVQFDLSPKSKKQFDRFRADLMYKQKIGKVVLGESVAVRATCELKTQNSNTYTEAVFKLHDAATA